MGSSTVAQQAQDAQDAELLALERRLQYRQGSIAIGDGLATLNVSSSFRYLAPRQAAEVLAAWGNPPGATTLGMIVPADASPLSDEGWGVVITYDDDGYVKDDDAATINYDDLLREMQKATRSSNKARQKAGYPAIDLVGWAEPPHYDQASHKLYWAKELQFGTEAARTLNYNIRVLGRRGVLVLNAVAVMEQLEDVRGDMGQVMQFVEFNDGHRYADFRPGTDHVAEYGIAALVAGGLAAKAGLFKGLLAILLAGKKLLIVVVAGIGVWLKRLLSGRSQPAPATPTGARPGATPAKPLRIR
jgi:uncharacterized membrane-anchored protein